MRSFPWRGRQRYRMEQQCFWLALDQDETVVMELPLLEEGAFLLQVCAYVQMPRSQVSPACSLRLEHRFGTAKWPVPVFGKNGCISEKGPRLIVCLNDIICKLEIEGDRDQHWVVETQAFTEQCRRPLLLSQKTKQASPYTSGVGPACLLLDFRLFEVVSCSLAQSQAQATVSRSFPENVCLTFLKFLCWKLLVLLYSSLKLVFLNLLLFNGRILTENLCVSVCFLFSSSSRSMALHSAQHGKQFERNAKQVKTSGFSIWTGS